MGRNFTWPEHGADGREVISLIWKTLSVIDVDNAGNNGRVAISLGRKRNRWPETGTIGRETITLFFGNRRR